MEDAVSEGSRMCQFRIALLLLAVMTEIAVAAQDPVLVQRRRKAFEELGRIEQWKPREWKRAYTYNTLHYTVKTNTSLNSARYIGKLMDMTNRRYREIFGVTFLQIPKLTVYAYSSQGLYEQHAAQFCIPPGMTSGLFTPEGPGAIHLPFVMTGNIHPSQTLFHEGTHQFVHQAINYRIPFSIKSLWPKTHHILDSTPVWLNEGLATYMETARYDGSEIEVGRVNAARLYHLQQMLEQGTCPTVKEVVSRRYGMPFGAEHYAVSWGLVYSMRHHWDKDMQRQNRQRFVHYIEAVRRGFFHSVIHDFKKKFMDGDRAVMDFDTKWRAYIGDASLEAFQKYLVPRGTKFAVWQEEWIQYIMRLRTDQPFGGTDVGADEAEEGKERLRR